MWNKLWVVGSESGKIGKLAFFTFSVFPKGDSDQTLCPALLLSARTYAEVVPHSQEC